MLGGAGADSLLGSTGYEVMYGEIGINYLSGGTGKDLLSGGPVRTHSASTTFEPTTDLNQPVGGLAVLIANCAAKARL